MVLGAVGLRGGGRVEKRLRVREGVGSGWGGLGVGRMEWGGVWGRVGLVEMG